MQLKIKSINLWLNINLIKISTLSVLRQPDEAGHAIKPNAMGNKQINNKSAATLFKDGMTIMVGGFLTKGTPLGLIDAIIESGAKELTVITNDAAFTDKGVGKLLISGQVRKMIGSHIGTNPIVGEMYNKGELEVEFVPQGTLAERIRSGGTGLGGVLTPVGIGTVIEQGKEKITVDGIPYLLEKPLRADVAVIGGSVGDESGNIVYLGTTQNFNPMMAMAAGLVIAECEKVVGTGEIPMEQVHTPSILVDYILENN